MRGLQKKQTQIRQKTLEASGGGELKKNENDKRDIKTGAASRPENWTRKQKTSERAHLEVHEKKGRQDVGGSRKGDQKGGIKGSREGGQLHQKGTKWAGG